jgi:putative endonuclease
MDHFVYVLRCADNTLYTGYTVDVEKRLKEHNGQDGTKLGAKYTRGRRPVTLVYQERFANRSDAQKRESVIKTLSRKEKEKLVARSGAV